MNVVHSSLLQALELLTPVEQEAVLAVAEYLKHQRRSEAEPSAAAAALLAELDRSKPRFATADTDLSPARQAARRFMRENPALMRLLAQ
jgi:ABC-type uncharacterized transport system substrate-binding protein